MPPKTRITRDMIINTAFEIVRTEGAESINARIVAKKLNCSTQPIMYHFKTIDELKAAVYEKSDWFHTEYLMNTSDNSNRLTRGIGLNYIRFAVEEPQLFRFLFQSGYADENSLLDMVDSEELAPVLNVMKESLMMSMEQTKEVFITVALFAHGYASIIANNSLTYDEDVIAMHMKRAYRGAILAVKDEETT